MLLHTALPFLRIPLIPGRSPLSNKTGPIGAGPQFYMFSPLALAAVLGLSLSSATAVAGSFSVGNGTSANNNTVQVVLPQGIISGVNEPQNNQDSFLGIPYAQPPLGQLRFAAPASLANDSTKIVDASQYGKVCLQDLTASKKMIFDFLIGH